MGRLDYVFASVGLGRSPGLALGGNELDGDAIAMAARGATLGSPRRSEDRPRRRRALAAAALLSVVLAASVYGALSSTGATGRAATTRAFKQGGLLSLPLAARAPVSQAIGSSQPAYRVRTQGSGLTAWSAPEHLSSSFAPAGVTVRSGQTSVGMRLTGVGYGTALRLWVQPSPVRATTVSPTPIPDSRSGTGTVPSGWSRASPSVVPRPESGEGRSPWRSPSPGALDPRLSSDRKSVDFGSARNGLRYTGLTAEDASGRPLRSWLSLSGGTLLLHVRTLGARYPLRIDPFVQGTKLSGGTANNEFGSSVALSADGKTALVGAPYDEDGSRSQGQAGAAFVFVLSGSKWEQQGSKLTGTGDEAIYFGNSVALSANGNTALVGAYETAVGGKEAEGFDQGAVYVFTRSSEKWTQQEVLLSGEKEHYVEFGWSVALSGDGKTAVVGGPEIGNGTPHAGHVWFFTHSEIEKKWNQQGSTLTGATDEELGSAVALSGTEGNTALIGAEGETEETDGGVGAVHVYTRAAEKWTQQATIPGKGEGSKFGTSVSLSENGNTALIGAPEHNNREGAAYVFTRSGSEWKEQQQLSGPSTLYLGGHVALSGAGTVALVGRIGTGGGVWAFTFSGGKWSELEELTGNVESLDFGSAVALSESGETAFVGGHENHAYPFSYEAPGSPPEAVTSAASEVTSAKAQLNGTVNPHGKEVTECKFEYGTTASYGSSVSCGSLPGKGEAPVPVVRVDLRPHREHDLPLPRRCQDLSRYRPRRRRDAHDADDEREGETKSESEPAKAKDEKLSVQASEGTGKVTIGPYGSNIGGPPLAQSEGKYIQVYHSEGATFKKMEYEDCELGEAKTLWWENPATGWEPIQEPVAVYDEVTKCITVKATESTTPSIAQLNDPRHVGGPSANEQFGKCEPTKHGHFEDALCTKEKYKEKNEVRSYKGKYEWLPEPVGCFAQKHGHFEDAGCTKEDFKEKNGVKSYKGKYEKGVNVAKVEVGPVVIGVPSQSSVDCTGSASSNVQMRAANQSLVTLTLTGCERAGSKCASADEMPGTIVSQPLESYSYEEGGEYFTTLAAQTLMSFTCSGTEYRLSGTAAGQLKASLNTLITAHRNDLLGSRRRPGTRTRRNEKPDPHPLFGRNAVHHDQDHHGTAARDQTEGVVGGRARALSACPRRSRSRTPGG